MKRITLKFTEKPSNAALAQAVADEDIHSYRFTGSSLDNLRFEIQEIDIMEELKTLKERMENHVPVDDDAWVVPAILTCVNCGFHHKGWMVRPKKWFDNKPYHCATYFCPNCPPIPSMEEWLWNTLKIRTEMPEFVTVKNKKAIRREPKIRTAIDLAEIEENL